MGADLATQPYEIRSFKGGLTDQWDQAQKNQYVRADNLLLAKDENPFSRPGSVLFDVTNAQLPGGNARVNRLINFAKDVNLLAVQGQRVFRYSAGWSEILSPSGGSAMPAPNGAATHYQSAEWKKQVFLTNDAGAYPTIVYADDTATWRSRTMGLPALANLPNYVTATQLAAAITLANDLRTQFNLHLANAAISGTTPHSSADTVAQGIMSGAAAATDLPTLLNLTNALMRAYTAHSVDAHGGAPVYHYYQQPYWAPSPPVTWALASTSVPADLPTTAAMLNDLKAKYNAHDSAFNASVDQSFHRANDAHQVTSTALPTLTSGASSTKSISALISAANQMNTLISSHINENGALPALHTTTPAGAGIGDVPTSLVATDWASLIQLTNLLIQIYTWHEWDSHYNSALGGTAPVRHRKITSKTNALSGVTSKPDTTGYWATGALMPVFSQLFLDANVATQADVAFILSDMQAKYNSHDLDASAHGAITASNHIGLIQTAIDFPEYANYTYALHYDYVFKVGQTQFEVAGPVFVLEVIDAPDPSLSPLTISNIPVLANGTGQAFDLTNVKIKIYRTLANQQVPNLIDTIANGTTTYIDRASDASIIPNAIYTTAGIPNSDPPPAAKFICQLRDYTFFANYADAAGNSFPNRIIQCSPAAPENCPGNFYEELPTDCLGLATANEKLIAWTASATYRIDGRFSIDGQGEMTAVPISSTVGLAASYSPVAFDDGVIFWGSDGIYFTDGYKVHRLSRYWTSSYLQILALNPSNIHGDFDKTGRRIWWTMQTPADATGSPTDVNACLILDMNHDPTNTENAVFTTASNGAHFAPSSLCFFNGQLIRGDTRGYVFKHDSSYTSDPKIVTSVSPSSWRTVPIIYDFISVAFDFDSARSRKWVTNIAAEFKNLGTKLSVQINSNNDDGRQFARLTPIFYQQKQKLAGVDVMGFKLAMGGYNPETLRGLIKEKRKFPAGHLRCQTKQIQFTNAFGIVCDSDMLGTVSVALGGGGIPQVTLSTGSWPSDMVDQVLYFPNDGYTQGFTVASQAGSLITTDNPGLTCPVGSALKWQAKGYAKDQKFRLVNYVISFALLGTQQTDAQEGDGGNKS